MGGTVIAKSTSGGAGIGGGDGYYADPSVNAGNISIHGGTVTATGGKNGAGIGGGDSNDAGSIIIDGGTVAATGGTSGAGIGGGSSGAGGSITIDGAAVTATGGTNGSGIGGGKSGAGGNITMNDTAEITAVSSGTTRPAIHTVSGSLNSAGTARVMIANYSAQKNANTNTAIFVKDNSSSYASVTPTVKYQSVAFTVPAGTYRLKTANLLQQKASPAYGIDFGISATGLTVFSGVTTATTHAVSIGALTGGSITPSSTLAVSGETINLNITPNTGKRLKAGTLVYNDGTADHAITGNSFIMPNVAVTVKAAFEENPPSLYSITIQNDGNGTASANPATAVKGTTVTLSSTPNSGYLFKEWQVVSGGVTVADNQFTMPDNAVTAKAVFRAINGASVNPTSGRFDLYAPSDVQTAVTWNDAASVTDVKAGSTFIGTNNYSVSGSTLTIKKDYLVTHAVGSIALTVDFDKGSPVTLTIGICDSTPLLTGISIKATPTKINYVAGQSLDLTGATIKLSYNDSSSKNIAVESAMVTGFDSSKTGSQTVTVTYQGKVTSFDVNVIPAVISDTQKTASVNLSDANLPSGVTSVTVGGGVVTDSSVTTLLQQGNSGFTIGGVELHKIELLDQNGNPIKNFGKVTVSLPIPAGMSGDLHVYWYDSDNHMFTDMKATQKDGYLIFETDHFSYYAVAQLNTQKAETTTTASTAADSTTANPKTGDNNPINNGWLWLCALPAAGIAGFTIVRKKFRVKKAR